MNKQRILGKNSLVVTARGKKEYASQIFQYDLIREIRLDVEKLEVKILMTYDESYFRVFDVSVSENLTKEKAQELVTNFYNNLVNASMKLTKEEFEEMIKKRNEIIEKVKKAQEKKK